MSKYLVVYNAYKEENIHITGNIICTFDHEYPTEDEIMDIYNELEKDLKLKSPVILNYIKMWFE